MTDVERVDDFEELLSLLRGLRGKLVEASVFYPQEEDGYALMSFSGEFADLDQRDERWKLLWVKDDALPFPHSVTIWPERFLEAELSFTGDAEDPIDDVDETRGHNSFLKIRCKGIVLDLIAYL